MSEAELFAEKKCQIQQLARQHGLRVAQDNPLILERPDDMLPTPAEIEAATQWSDQFFKDETRLYHLVTRLRQELNVDDIEFDSDRITVFRSQLKPNASDIINYFKQFDFNDIREDQVEFAPIPSRSFESITRPRCSAEESLVPGP